MMKLNSLKVFVLSAAVACVSTSIAEARGFRVSMIPHGGQAGRCAACHNNPGGGGPRTPFGQDVNGLVGRGSRDPFWSLDLANTDSDGDGFTNGAELGDFDGDGVSERSVNISNPGDPNSSPVAAAGDCNLDTVLNAGDLSCVTTVDDRDAVLTSLGTLPGDLDGDGEVAFSDFLVLSTNFGSESPRYSDGNIDLSDTVGFSDFLVLSANFEQKPAGAAAVPEPSGFLLGAAGFLGILVRRKSRSCQK